MTIQITRPEIGLRINRRLETGDYQDAEDVILRALKSSAEVEGMANRHKLVEAIERLMNFGKTHSLSLGGQSIRELREEARP